MLDDDGDGRLEIDEFVTGLKQLVGHRPNCSVGNLQMLAHGLDVDGSGYIDWVEWVAVALLSADSSLLCPEPLLTAFRLLDRPSGDGLIGSADILAVVDVSNFELNVEHFLTTSKLLDGASGDGALDVSNPSLTFEDFKHLIDASTLRLDKLSGEDELLEFVRGLQVEQE